jgi:hypothetical protein
VSDVERKNRMLRHTRGRLTYRALKASI